MYSLQKRLYAYAASPLSEPLVDLQAETAQGVDLSPQSVQVCETRHDHDKLTLIMSFEM